MRKILSLQWSRLRQYYKNNRFIFVLFLVSSIVCTTGFIYLYGNLIMSMRLRNDDSRIYRRYSLSFENVEYSYDDIAERMGKLDLPVEDSIVYNSYFDSSNGSMVNLATPVTGEMYVVPVDGRHSFTNEELREGANVMIIPHFFLKVPAGLDQATGIFEYAGETFQVIGHHARPDDCYVPPETFQRLNLKITNLRIILTHKAAGTAENTDNVEKLKSLFPGGQIDSSYEYIRLRNYDFPTELTMICLVYALSLFSFMFLMKYMMETSIKENVIYGIVGASKNRITGLLLLDNVCFSAFTALAGILLHMGLKNVFFDKVNIQSDIPLTYLWSDYLLLFILCVVISQLTLLPFLIGFRKHSLLSAKGRYSYM
jgi:hypothetical protein